MRDNNEFLRGKPAGVSGEQLIRLVFRVITLTVIFFGVWASTQKFCYLVNYEPGWVGAPLRSIALGGRSFPVYHPLLIFKWFLAYYRYLEIQPFIYSALAPAGWASLGAISFYFLMEFFLARNKQQNIFGTARWANEKDMKKAGLLEGQGGIILGQTRDARVSADYDTHKNNVILHLKKKGVHYLIQSGIYNVLLAAPTRSGKGVSNVIPTLLSYPGSCIVLDFKGENFNMTSGYRKKFGKVYRWNPTGGADDPGHYFNPLMEIRSGDESIADANLIADILTAKQDGPPDHWSSTAKALLTGLILGVLADPEWKNKSLAGCLEYLAQIPPEEEKDNPKWVYDKMLAVAEKGCGWPLVDQAIIEAVGAQRSRPDDEAGSVRSTVNDALSVFSDPKIKRSTSTSEFYINEFEETKRPITLYITIQYSDVDRIAPLIRMFILLMSRRFTSGETQATKRKFTVPVLFILDEFDKLGKMDELERAAGIHNGFGIHYFWIFQSPKQLDKIYGKDHAFFSHANTSILFTPGKGDLDTAKMISEVCGKESFSKANISYSGGRGQLGYNNASLSSQDQERNLINPDEVMNMPRDRFILLVQNFPPYIGKKNVFYEDPLFKSHMTGEPAFSTRAKAAEMAMATVEKLKKRRWFDAAADAAKIKALPEEAPDGTGAADADSPEPDYPVPEGAVWSDEPSPGDAAAESAPAKTKAKKPSDEDTGKDTDADPFAYRTPSLASALSYSSPEDDEP